MKLRLLILFLITSFQLSNVLAQYVTIPDANFRVYLQTHFDFCMNGSGLLDTTCAASLSSVTIRVNNLNISDLSGVQYFKHLGSLSCDSNNLTNLPTLPSSLMFLNCRHNQLTILPDLPNIIYLNCNNNQLTSLPSSPLTWILTLNCSNNKLTSLPSIPPILRELNCDSNLLTSLPSLQSPYLMTLFCSGNKITVLPDLHGLRTLYCENNQLNCLPNLPENLRDLRTKGNNIVCLPNIPYNPNSLNNTFISDIGTAVCSNSNNPNICPIATGVFDSIESEDLLMIYPNPSKGNLRIEYNKQIAGNATIKILNHNGVEVYNYPGGNLDNIILDLSQEQKGIYFVQFVTEKNVIMKKLVIE